MPATVLSHFNLRADRPVITALRDFYVDAIGLTVGYRPPFHVAGFWLYIGDVDVLHLTETKPDETRLPHAINTFHHVAFGCTGRSAFEERLRHLQISFTNEQVPLTNLHQLFCADPAGNGVELNFVEPRS